jgi:hypothetical protein
MKITFTFLFIVQINVIKFLLFNGSNLYVNKLIPSPLISIEAVTYFVPTLFKYTCSNVNIWKHSWQLGWVGPPAH